PRCTVPWLPPGRPPRFPRLECALGSAPPLRTATVAVGARVARRVRSGCDGSLPCPPDPSFGSGLCEGACDAGVPLAFGWGRQRGPLRFEPGGVGGAARSPSALRGDDGDPGSALRRGGG